MPVYVCASAVGIGFSLNPLPIQYDVVILLTLSALILLGNVCYPIALRAVVWCCMKCARDKTLWLFLLRHPRVCYTALFPVRSLVLVV